MASSKEYLEFVLGVWLQWQSTDTCTGKSERTVQTDDCKS